MDGTNLYLRSYGVAVFVFHSAFIRVSRSEFDHFSFPMGRLVTALDPDQLCSGRKSSRSSNGTEKQSNVSPCPPGVRLIWANHRY
jgi:hypothetical protein